MTPVQSKPIQISGVDKMSFLDLPPEIRNAIYELCLVNTGVMNAIATIKPGLARIESVPRVRLHLQPHLLIVCRQIYQEAVPVLYGNCLFGARFDKDDYRKKRNKVAIVQASDRRREAVKHIRQVEIPRFTNQTEYFILLQDLVEMPNLTKVKIDYRFSDNFRTPKTMSKALLPLLLNLVNYTEGTNGDQGIDQIEFHLAHRGFPVYITQSFADEVKNLLRVSLT